MLMCVRRECVSSLTLFIVVFKKSAGAGAEAGSDRHGHAKSQFSPNYDLRLSPQLQPTQTTFKTCDLYIIISAFSSSIY
jgi:hypothetical protein